MKHIRWSLVMIAGLGTMVLLMLADVVFVTHYALLGNPGQEQAFYNQFAEDTAAAFVFCFAPLPLYLISRWLCARAGSAPWAHALLLVASFYVLDVAMLAGMGLLQGLARPEYWLNGLALLAGALAGAWFHVRSQHSTGSGSPR